MRRHTKGNTAADIRPSAQVKDQLTALNAEIMQIKQILNQESQQKPVEDNSNLAHEITELNKALSVLEGEVQRKLCLRLNAPDRTLTKVMAVITNNYHLTRLLSAA